MSKPMNVVNISITGRERNAAQYLADLEVAAMRGHLRDYEDAHQPVPEDVRRKAEQMGIEICSNS